MQSTPHRGRRAFITLAAGAALTALAAPAIAAPRPIKRRTIGFHNLHTNETLDLVYWQDGHYQPVAMRRIARLLRDSHNGDIHAIDPKLIDVLVALRMKLKTRDPVQVVCGYRSPVTNAMLVATTEGVATDSYHLRGRAIDMRIPGRSLGTVHRAALALKAGGVGYYPHSDFVHVDVGPVRH